MPWREAGLGGLDDSVVVRAHEAQHVHLPFEAAHDEPEEADEVPAVVIVAVDEGLGDSTRADDGRCRREGRCALSRVMRRG